MNNRKHIIEGLLQNMHAMRHKLMVGYIDKKGGDITPSQGFVLRFVAKNDGTNIKVLSQTLHITSSAATQLVDSLVEKGYILRKENPADRRAITLTLSEKAQKLFKEFKEQCFDQMTDLFGALSDEELNQYAVLNQKIADGIVDKKS